MNVLYNVIVHQVGHLPTVINFCVYLLHRIFLSHVISHNLATLATSAGRKKSYTSYKCKFLQTPPLAPSTVQVDFERTQKATYQHFSHTREKQCLQQYIFVYNSIYLFTAVYIWQETLIFVKWMVEDITRIYFVCRLKSIFYFRR